MKRARLALGAALVAGISSPSLGCEFLIKSVSLAQGDGGPDGDASDDVTDAGSGESSLEASVDAGRCGRGAQGARRGAGPDMVEVPAGGASYCIDVTEVTVAQFNEYVIAGAPRVGVPPHCSDAVAAPPANEDPGAQHLPISTVNICDAWGFCRWAGKRLCGSIGDGGTIRLAPSDQQSEWHYACRNGVLNYSFPYGAVYDASTCNTEGKGPVDVASSHGCHGVTPPFDQIFDMNGNQWEFIYDLDPDPSSNDTATGSFGGAWNSGSLGCANGGGANAYVFDFNESGIRCCADSDATR
jgi:formylglycine-generating enzyme required for sulfatase activity